GERMEQELAIVAERTEQKRGPVFDQDTLQQPIARLISRTPLSVGLDATLQDAVRIMREARVGCVLVIDAGGYLVGIFTERDLLLRLEDADLSRNIRPYMTEDPEALPEADPSAFALNLISV